MRANIHIEVKVTRYIQEQVTFVLHIFSPEPEVMKIRMACKYLRS